MEECVVRALLSSLCFLKKIKLKKKRRKWRGRSSNASVSLSPEKWETVEKGLEDLSWPWSRACYPMPLCHTGIYHWGTSPRWWWWGSRFGDWTICFQTSPPRKRNLLLMTSSYRWKLFGSHWHIKADSLDVLRWYFVWVWCKILMHDQHYLASWQLRRRLAQTRTDTAEQIFCFWIWTPFRRVDFFNSCAVFFLISSVSLQFPVCIPVYCLQKTHHES